MPTNHVSKKPSHSKHALFWGAAAIAFGVAAYAAHGQTVSSQSCYWQTVSNNSLAWQGSHREQVCTSVSYEPASSSGPSSETYRGFSALPPGERYKSPEELQADHDRKAVERAQKPWIQPREVSLCPAPSRMTADGCQPANYRPHFIVTR